MAGIDRRVLEILPRQASPKIGLFRVLLCLCFKTSLSANTNLSNENEFCMQFHFHANQSHFHNNGFALRLALKQRHKETRKWPIIWGLQFQLRMRSSTKHEEPGNGQSGLRLGAWPTPVIAQQQFHSVLRRRNLKTKYTVSK